MNGWAVACAVAVASSWWLARPPAAVIARWRWDPQTPVRHVVGRRGVVAVLPCAVVVALAWDPAAVTAAAAVGGAVGFGAARWRSQRRRSHATAVRAEVAAAVDVLGAEVRSGAVPSIALENVAVEAVAFAPVARALGAGSDPVVALRVAASRPGAEALTDLAAAWALAERSGAPLVHVLDELATSIRDDLDVRRDVRAEAEPARATGRLMATLPLLGLGLGAGLGGDPITVLTRTLPGACCLAVGVALACCGVAWIDRVADAAEAVP